MHNLKEPKLQKLFYFLHEKLRVIFARNCFAVGAKLQISRSKEKKYRNCVMLEREEIKTLSKSIQSVIIAVPLNLADTCENFDISLSTERIFFRGFQDPTTKFSCNEVDQRN